MLVLTRRVDETVIIDVPASETPTQIRVKVTDIRGDKVRVGFEAPHSIAINREEVYEQLAKTAERNAYA